MSKESGENRTFEEACSSARQTIHDLGEHMDSFEKVFSDDKECWRGEAASEEQYFISSDKQYLDELLHKVEVLITDE